MTDILPPVPGWYGKIPSLGDFASRRLPQNFINDWHDWLQRGIAASRHACGEDWLAVYLNSPIWRFLLMPGICGEAMWAGTLMPSVDKVGRYFPLTIALQTSASAHPLAMVTPGLEWYARLEHISLAMLDVAATTDDLDQGLAAAPFPVLDANAQELALWWKNSGAGAKLIDLGLPPALSELMQHAALDVFMTLAANKSLWWTADQPKLHCFNGMPPSSFFSILLGN